MCSNRIITTFRFNDALRDKDIDTDLATQFLAFFERLQASFDAFNSWSDVSCKLYSEYKTCDGDLLLNWKAKGYSTVFDLIEVTKLLVINQ